MPIGQKVARPQRLIQQPRIQSPIAMKPKHPQLEDQDPIQLHTVNLQHSRRIQAHVHPLQKVR